jgi:hypothetical protein
MHRWYLSLDQFGATSLITVADMGNHQINPGFKHLNLNRPQRPARIFSIGEPLQHSLPCCAMYARSAACGIVHRLSVKVLLVFLAGTACT